MCAGATRAAAGRGRGGARGRARRAEHGADRGALFGRPLGIPAEELLRCKHACTQARAQFGSRLVYMLETLRVPSRLRAVEANERLRTFAAARLGDAVGCPHDALPARLSELGCLLSLDDEHLVGEAVAQVMTMNYGGSGAAGWALYHLASEPALLERLRDEAALLDGSEPARLAELPFAEAVVKETLRLHPTFTLMAREALGDCAIGGVHISAGDLIVICPYLVHRDGRYWPEPDRFDPGRWLQGPAGAARLSYLPFGAGPRKCLGMHAVWRAVAASVATVASLWDYELVGPAPDPTANRPTGLRLRVQPTRREGVTR